MKFPIRKYIAASLVLVVAALIGSTLNNSASAGASTGVTNYVLRPAAVHVKKMLRRVNTKYEEGRINPPNPRSLKKIAQKAAELPRVRGNVRGRYTGVPFADIRLEVKSYGYWQPVAWGDADIHGNYGFDGLGLGQTYRVVARPHFSPCFGSTAYGWSPEFTIRRPWRYQVDLNVLVVPTPAWCY